MTIAENSRSEFFLKIRSENKGSASEKNHSNDLSLRMRHFSEEPVIQNGNLIPVSKDRFKKVFIMPGVRNCQILPGRQKRSNFSGF